MVIFYAEHNGVMTNFISLRYQFHAEEEAVLFMQQAPPEEVCRRLEENGVFTKIVDVNIEPTPKNTFKSNEPELVEKEVIAYYDNLFETNDVNIANVDKIYYATDTATVFALYLCMKKIKFNYVEMISNQITNIEERCKVASTIVTQAFWDKMVELDTHMQYPEKTNLLENYYVYVDSVIPNNYKDRVIKIDFNRLMDSFNSNVYTAISRGFTFDDRIKVYTPTVSIIATPGHGRMMGITKLKLNKLPLLYQIMLDYYLPSDISVLSKPHPRRPIEIKSCAYGGKLREIPKWFPIEYIPFYKEMEAEYLLIADELLLHKLKGRYEGKMIVPTDNYYKNSFFAMTHRYYSALELLTHLNGYSLKNYGVHQNALTVFAQNVIDANIFSTFHKMNMLENGDFLIASNLEFKEELPDINQLLLNAEEKSIVIFCDIGNKFWGYDIKHPEILDYFLVQKIQKTKIDSEMEIISDTCTEYNFVFCKDSELRKKMLSLEKVTKKMRHTGIELSISFCDSFEQKSILHEVRITALENYIINNCSNTYSEKSVLWDKYINNVR